MEAMLLFVARAVVGFIFLTTGIEKVSKPETLRSTLRRWTKSLLLSSRGFVRIIGGSEAILGASLFLPYIWLPGALVASWLLAGLAMLVGRWTLQGARGNCGCGGIMQGMQMDWLHVSTLVVLSGVAGALVISGLTGEPGVLTEHSYLLPIVLLLYTMLNVGAYLAVRINRRYQPESFGTLAAAAEKRP